MGDSRKPLGAVHLFLRLGPARAGRGQPCVQAVKAVARF
jgi:hypothetical protein